ncbi:class 1 fructose-bisphosphatase [Helicobacter sp. 11S02629-2]|uniref:class 1 fructose-bisphosphatase n=1 Tax=Helicobacter sp. 11S02629-2 TaxID=1476195 RepID=UPI000BA7A63A|nr:class 1 fructose-bisphosphatase [Helicobacter sp. 11S02629-2]PAF46089.1 fructose-bisphosphatase [Helicobacter sp. 11S02629-2]
MEKNIEEILEVLKAKAVVLSEMLKERLAGYSDINNASGDHVLKIDMKADLLFGEALKTLKCVKGYVSEEQPNFVDVNKDASLIVTFDPLDGSSLVDSNLSIGSIFGIYEGGLKGENLVTALYFIYGPRLELVVAKKEAKHYVYVDKEWKFIQDFKMESKGKLNSPGGTQKYWDKKHKELIDSFFARGYRLRYSGGMVADLHQILCKKGGIFSYPATSDAKSGKLRILFEVFPFAFIYEKAGGEASDGKKRLLDIEVPSLHASTPCFFGSKVEMKEVSDVYR